MDNSMLWTLICTGGVVLLIVITIAPGFFFASLLTGKITADVGRIDEERNLLRKSGGVIAPAVILTAKLAMTINKVTHIVDFEADVFPEGRQPFRAAFRGSINRRGFEVRRRQMVNEVGQKIWVIFDPNNTSRVFLEHYDDEHEAIIKFHEKEFRRLDFDKLLSENAQILAYGVEAEAKIIKVEYLDVTSEAQQMQGVHTYLEVYPKSGLPFPAEAYGQPGINKLKKYTVGRTFFVKYDPRNPHRAVFDTEKNRSLPDVL